MLLTINSDINVEVLDSRDDSRYTYFLIDNCKFMALKSKLNDECYIMHIVGKECHIQLDTKGCGVNK